MNQHVSLLRQNEHLVFGWNRPFQVKSYFLRVLDFVVFIDNITKDEKVPFRSSLPPSPPTILKVLTSRR